jgi:hypothetical protein
LDYLSIGLFVAGFARNGNFFADITGGANKA